MANLKRAFAYVMSDEDPTLAGEVAVDNNGARVRFGFNEKYHKKLTDMGFYDTEKMGREDALETAVMYFNDEYAAPVCAASLSSDAVAAKLCDLSFNIDPRDATHVVQQSLNAIGGNVVEDGRMGPLTVAAINAADPARLLPAMCEAQESFYRRSAAHNVTVAHVLHGLVERARKYPRFVEQADEATA